MKMKSTYMFRDQVQKVTNWFKAWNECEQTVALFSLLRKVSTTQTKFLLQVLEQTLTDSTEIQALEIQANNPAYISNLCIETKDRAVAQLLTLLPLLHPGNTEAKTEYLKILPRILNHSVENGCHIEESRQLLSYSLIHPAMDAKERSRLTMWLTHLEERYAYNAYQQGSQSQNGESELISQFLEKNGHTRTTTDNGRDNWQQLSGSLRDRGNNNDVDSSGSSTAGNQNGRAITSTAALNTPTSCSSNTKLGSSSLLGGSSSSGLASSGLDLNLNGAGFTTDCPAHLMLQPSLSGPPSFSNVPSTQASSNNLHILAPNHLHQLQHHHLGSSTNSSHGNGNSNNSNSQHANGHRKLTRSLSAVTPSGAGSHVSDWLNRHHDEMVMHAQLTMTQSEPPHAPLSPQSSVTSSGSGSEGQHNDDQQSQLRNTFLEEGSGMRDVPVWLKSLRLHKYSYLFQTMTYEEMMTLTEDWLKSQDVTKGARNKIILNIKKLQERPNCLRTMEKEIMESGNMKQALTELKSMMNTPLKQYTSVSNTTTPVSVRPPTTPQPEERGGNASSTEGSGNEGSVESSPDNKGTVENSSDMAPVTEIGEAQNGDLPGMITKVLGKLCTQLLVSTRPEDECFSMYLQMLDKCMMHEAFTVDQKKKLLSWRQQIQKVWHPMPQRYGIDRQRKGFGNTFPPNSLLRGQRALRGQTVVTPGVQPTWTFGGRPPVTMSPIGTGTGAGIPLYHASFAPPFIRPTIMDLKAPVTRTHSAPIKSNQFGFAIGSRPAPEQNATEPEINARLDSLCLSMTEHALGSVGDLL